jgi:PIN domain nuclease of toxin-antitoxin system
LRLLLDTNIVIMLLLDEQRLPRQFLMALSNPQMPVVVSAVSVWEIAIKQRKGKLDLLFPLDELEERLTAASIAVLPLTARHALGSAALPDGHKDPFDRVIVAVAEVEGCSLLTTDAKLLDHPLAWRP